MKIKAVIFDLDGVVLSTDEYHFRAWKKMAESEGIPFTKDDNERLRGVGRMESLDIILEKSEREYSEEEKKKLAEYKNNLYRESLQNLSPAEIYPGVVGVFDMLEEKKVRIAIGSSSKNTKFILKQVGLFDRFKGAISDGTNITKSKPDPQVFLMAADMVETQPENSLVVEDAYAGVEAAKAGNMYALAVGTAVDHKDADFAADNVTKFNFDSIL